MLLQKIFPQKQKIICALEIEREVDGVRKEKERLTAAATGNLLSLEAATEYLFYHYLWHETSPKGITFQKRINQKKVNQKVGMNLWKEAEELIS